MKNAIVCLLVLIFGASAYPQKFDLIIRGGMVYDGSGGPPVRADVAITGDKVVRIGKLKASDAKNVIDANGLAVAPGFINMLSWSNESLIEDGRSQGEIRQGVTLEVMGEGESMGPLSDTMKKMAVHLQSDIRYPIQWTTLGEYLDFITKKGISPNVASFVGATTVRIHELAPQGVNVVFENVGGEILEASLQNIALRGRVVLCGGISGYNAIKYASQKPQICQVWSFFFSLCWCISGRRGPMSHL